MCGFVVTLSADGRTPYPRPAQLMCESIAHRGPDDAGNFSEHGVAFAFRRLAIFDLSQASRQPMSSADGRHVLVFNGAIYNFVELRKELRALGNEFRTTGDSEVLLAAYRQWGAECLHRFNGMWAFAIYDRSTRRIFVARDRFGIKPLYWHHDTRGLVLASEIKAIRDSGVLPTRPNWRTVARFLLEDTLDVDNETFYEDIHRMPAGTFFEGDASAPPQFRRYWDLREAAMAADEPDDPVAAFREVFDDAVRMRMRADVPTGVLLSGGLDSTSILASMASQNINGRLEALCYVDPAFDETPLIQETIEQTGAVLCPLEANPETLWSSLEKHLWHQDEPVHSFTSVVIYELMRLARERGLKVLLNGQGADEALGGYSSFFLPYWSDLLLSGRPIHAHREINRFARARELSAPPLFGAAARKSLNVLKQRVPGYHTLAARSRRRRIANQPFVSEELKRHWEPDAQPPTRTLDETLRASLEYSALPLYLRVEDRNSMAHGIEERLPFLDYRLVTLAFRLRASWKLSGEYTKVILRSAMEDRIPESIRTRVPKFGFPTSAREWFRTTLFERCKDVIASRAFRESGAWDVPEVERGLSDLEQGRNARIADHLFDIVQFGLWQTASKH